MAQRDKKGVRMPATKFPQLQKKLNLNRYRSRPIEKRSPRDTSGR
ncbi:MAG TPA: hypothetical protein VFI31_27660 [Pirellulales bacterium]|nr:hypothetical protein [Pirellulales bacterium]